MYYELYVDVFFLMNFTMDTILLALLKKALACPVRYGRIIAGTEDGEEKTQKEVADMLGISQSYISRLEKKIMQRLRREMVKYS